MTAIYLSKADQTYGASPHVEHAGNATGHIDGPRPAAAPRAWLALLYAVLGVAVLALDGEQLPFAKPGLARQGRRRRSTKRSRPDGTLLGGDPALPRG